jgi:hypothetical protein
MIHTDLGSTNAMIAAHQENVARMLREGHRPGIVRITIGSLLVRLGEWLRKDVEMPRRAESAASARRPQTA